MTVGPCLPLLRIICLEDLVADIYGESLAIHTSSNGVANGANIETRSTIHLSLCDTLQGHGPISNLTFSIARYGVSSSPISSYCRLASQICSSRKRASLS